MRTEYRFLQTRSGISYFARVTLEYDLGRGGWDVLDDLPQTVDETAGEMNRATAAEWIEAALDGMRDVVKTLDGNGGCPPPGQVRLVNLVGSALDTRPDVAYCAAAQAAWQLLRPADPMPEAVFDGRAWSVRLPVPASIAVP